MNPKLFIIPAKKLKFHKKEIAPIGFYFDLFTNGFFKIPITPIPMRIDKLTNGKPTLIIISNRNELRQFFEGFELIINFNSFFPSYFLEQIEKNLIRIKIN